MVNWYNIYSLTDFLALELVSLSITVRLQEVGEKEILLTKGNTNGVLYEDQFLPINFLGHNPYSREGHAVYLDGDNDIWLGIEVDA